MEYQALVSTIFVKFLSSGLKEVGSLRGPFAKTLVIPSLTFFNFLYKFFFFMAYLSVYFLRFLFEGEEVMLENL